MIGLCECGCGGITPIAKRTQGDIKAGQHQRFIAGHKSLRSLADRLWSGVNVRGEDECWPWRRRARLREGYGKLCVTVGFRDQRIVPAHRVAWEVTHGAIPEGLLVLHRCDYPPCCNPSHLFLGTFADNMADKISKGRARGRFSKTRVESTPC